MPHGQASDLLRQVRRWIDSHKVHERTDGELLQRFAADRDEAAFAALMQRHGPLVWSVCRRILRHEHDAEDAFQATFLVLARKAASVRKQEAVGSWLYGVAYRMAMQAKRTAAKRREQDHPVQAQAAEQPATEAALRELQALLDEEVCRLPQKYRAPFLLCCLQGRSKREAAQELGWKEGTVSSRLAHARKLLQARLTRRGVTLSAALGVMALSPNTVAAALPAGLVMRTLKVALQLAAGTAVTGVVTARVAALVKGGASLVCVSQGKMALGFLFVLSLIAAGASVVGSLAPPEKPAETKQEGSKLVHLSGDDANRDPQPAVRTDRYGDPLPDGALVRLGTLRWRAGSEVASLTYTPDGNTLVAVARRGVCLFDVATGKLIDRFGPFGLSIQRTALSPDGKRLLAWTSSNKPGERNPNVVHIWELPDGRQTLQADGENAQWLGWSAEGQPLAVYLGEEHILLRELAGGKERRFEAKDLPTPARRLSACAYAASAKVLAIPDEYSVIHVWDAATGRKRWASQANGESVWSLAFSPDGRTLASLTREGVQLWDAAAGKVMHFLAADQKYMIAVAFAPDGKTLLTVGWDDLRIWDVATGGRERELTKHAGRSFSPAVAFSPDGKTLATVEGDSGTIHLWDVATGTLKPGPTGHASWPNKAAFSPDGRRLATGGMDGTIFFWDPVTGEPLAEIRCRECVRDYAFSADGRYLFSSWTGDKLYVSDAATGRELHVIQMEDPDRPDTRQSGMYLFLSDDRKTLVALSYYYPKNQGGPFPELLVSGWDTATRKQLFRRRCGCNSFGIAVSADARILAASQGGGEGTELEESPGKEPIRLEDLATGEQLLTLPVLEGQTQPLAFSPDGRLLVTKTHTFGPGPPLAGGGHAEEHATTLRLWDLVTATEILALPTEPNGRVAFSPDGRVLALSAPSQEILLWDLRRGKELQLIKRLDAEVTGLAFSPDGSRLVSGLSDSTLLVWDVSAVAKAAQPSSLDAEGAARAWADLAADAPKAFAARWGLAGTPDKAVPLLREHLKPAQSADATRLRRLLADLDSDRFAVREEARKSLEELSDLAAPALRQALMEKPSLETSRRIEALLQKRHGPVTQPERLRALRATAVLEDIATPEARRVLASLAQGAPEARLTQEAKAALERLTRRPPDGP